MTTLLFANVGNHDLKLTDPSLLPDEMQKDPRVHYRTLGEELLANYARYAPALHMPMLGPTLRWLVERQGIDPLDLHVYLFASDQNPDYTPQSEWLKDTLPFARVVERILKDGGLVYSTPGKDKPVPLRLSRKQVRIRRMEGNPADYRNALDFFSRELPRQAERAGPVDAVYLEVTGGTPAMTSMLIVAGVEVFGQQAHTLYVARDQDRPSQVGVSQQLFARHTRATLRTQAALHAYAVAYQGLTEHGTLAMPDGERRALLCALLDYADRRLAFDFGRARDALAEARRYASGDTQAQAAHWSRQLTDPEAQDLIAELVHSARIKYELGDYADFTQRLFRFQEASFRHLAKDMGMVCKDKNDEFVDMDWVNGVQGLTDFLADYTAPDGKRYHPLQIDGRSLNRISLGAIVNFFVQRHRQWSKYQPTVDAFYQLSKVAGLRNKGLAGHGFQGIGKQDLDNAWGKDADTILSSLVNMYEDLFDQPIGPNPYAAVNGLILDLLAD